MAYSVSAAPALEIRCQVFFFKGKRRQYEINGSHLCGGQNKQTTVILRADGSS